MAELHENGEERELDLSDDKVVTKYKAAAEICNSESAVNWAGWIGKTPPGVEAGPCGQPLLVIHAQYNVQFVQEAIAHGCGVLVSISCGRHGLTAALHVVLQRPSLL